MRRPKAQNPPTRGPPGSSPMTARLATGGGCSGCFNLKNLVALVLVTSVLTVSILTRGPEVHGYICFFDEATCSRAQQPGTRTFADDAKAKRSDAGEAGPAAPVCKLADMYKLIACKGGGFNDACCRGYQHFFHQNCVCSYDAWPRQYVGDDMSAMTWVRNIMQCNMSYAEVASNSACIEQASTCAKPVEGDLLLSSHPRGERRRERLALVPRKKDALASVRRGWPSAAPALTVDPVHAPPAPASRARRPRALVARRRVGTRNRERAHGRRRDKRVPEARVRGRRRADGHARYRVSLRARLALGGGARQRHGAGLVCAPDRRPGCRAPAQLQSGRAAQSVPAQRARADTATSSRCPRSGSLALALALAVKREASKQPPASAAHGASPAPGASPFASNTVVSEGAARQPRSAWRERRRRARSVGDRVRPRARARRDGRRAAELLARARWQPTMCGRRERGDARVRNERATPHALRYSPAFARAAPADPALAQ